MIFTHHTLQVDLSDEWWADAEMAGFVPVSRSYRADPTFSKNGAPIVEISIADICPVHRSVGIFRDSEDGVPAREKTSQSRKSLGTVQMKPLCVWTAALHNLHRRRKRNALGEGHARIPSD
jgi:hypothetical protein